MSESPFKRSEQITEAGVTPYERIPELQNFYASGMAVHSNIIEVEPKKKMSEESKGQWVTEQFSSAAKTLFVLPFVTPIEKGGIEIPEISPQEDYYEAYLRFKGDSMQEFQDSIEFKRIYVEKLKKKLSDILTEQRRKGQHTRPQDDSDDLEIAADVETQADDADKEYDKAYSKWEKQLKSLQEDRQTIENWKEECRKQANRQFDADCDALARMHNALAALKKFLQDLMKKVPDVVEVVHSKRESDGLDPFEENDMRQCMANLLLRYRKDDELGILTTVIQGMKEQQGSKNLSTHIRNVEDWRQDMRRLGVETVSIDDLAAFIAISGMQEVHRTEFMEQENIFTLALQQFDGHDSDDDCSVSSRRKKPLFSKVRDYAKKHDDTRLINQKLRPKETTSSSPESTRELRQRMVEAQQAFNVATKKDRSTKSREQSGICFYFAKHGSCNRGDRCTYKHERASSDTGGGQPTTGSNQHSAAATHAVQASTPAITKKSAGGKKSVLFDVRSEDWDEDNDKEQKQRATCVIVESRAGMADCNSSKPSDQAHSVTTTSGPHNLGWDTMASLHVAKTLEVIPGAKKIRTDRQAEGLGGSKHITHQGISPLFGLEMAYIDGGLTPNLLSVGTALQADDNGQTGVAIFSHKGAIRMRKNEEIEAAISAIVDRATELDLVEGYATMKNGVYTEAFGSNIPELSTASNGATACAVASMYASRVPFASEYQVIGMLVSAGVSQTSLINGIKTGTIKGLPENVTEAQVNKYFREVGKDEDMATADITTLPLREPHDYTKLVSNTPGQVLYLDGIDPSFSRMTGHHLPTSSIGGFKDTVMGVDGASGFVDIQGRVSKKDSHVVVSYFIKKWNAKFDNQLRLVKTDKEFVTRESKLFADTLPQLRLSQAVPYEHRRGLDMGEGTGRWIQDLAQGHMNRAQHWVKQGLLTEVQWRSLWFHAMKLAEVVHNMKPSLCNPDRTRYEEAHGVPFNLSELVILPFATPTIVRKGESDNDGRGDIGLYLGPSETVKGGILTLCLATGRVQQKYSFVARDRFPKANDIDIGHAAKYVYGKLSDASGAGYISDIPAVTEKDDEEYDHADERLSASVDDTSEVPSDPDLDAKYESQDTLFTEEPVDLPLNSHTEFQSSSPEPTTTDQDSSEAPMRPTPSTSTPLAETDKDNKTRTRQSPPRGDPQEHHRYYTRSAKRQVFSAFAVEERPLKPKAPTRREAIKRAEWVAASAREQQKLIEEQVFLPCPLNANGEPILPDNPVIIPLMDLYEYKWKTDPVTGEERWLECVRIVGNGAHDDRPDEKTYALTPDRSVLFYMLSMGASLGEQAMTGDAIRAYLNAPSIDRNIVITAPERLHLLPRVSMLNKGLYGTIKGALSFQVWVDDKMTGMGYQKCDVARGVYLKRQGEHITRVYRHSDDFRVSSQSPDMLNQEVQNIQANIRTNGFSPDSRFLGVTIEHRNHLTGEEDRAGKLVVIRMEEKIEQMYKDYGYLTATFNPRGRPREAPLPINALKEDLTDDQTRSLDDKQCKVYMGLVGMQGWITATPRVDAKFAYWVHASKTSKPRMWDMYLAVYTMEYLYLTKDLPLILGGPDVEPEVLTDASFAIMPERRSVKAHVARTGPASGVFTSACGAIKNCIKSVWEAELMGASDGCDTCIYTDHLGTELGYGVKCEKVKCDNESTLNWIEGCLPSKSSRHVEVRLYNARHLCEEGKIHLSHVSSEMNIADILTKPLPVKQFKILCKMVLGHLLVTNFALRGVK